MHRVLRCWLIVLALTIAGRIARTEFQPVAVIVPHHNIVAGIRQDLLQFIAERRPATLKIILVSPDHFSANQHMLLTSTSLLDQISGVVRDDTVVAADHGITNVKADLTDIFPNTEVETLLIGQLVTPAQLAPVLKTLTQQCGSDCLLVASVDFSHYLPAAIAATHDETTISWLASLHSEALLHSEVDSPQSLWLASEFAQSHQAQRWRLFDHTNSGLMLNNFSVETTSHVFGWYQKGGKVSAPESHSFVVIPTAADVISLGERLNYGATETTHDMSTTINRIHFVEGTKNQIECEGATVTVTSNANTIVTGWDDGTAITLGLVPINGQNDLWKWSKQIPTITMNAACKSLFHFLPGTIAD